MSGTEPRLVVEMTLGSLATDDTAGLFVLGTSVLGGTDVLGTAIWVDVTADLVSVTIPPDSTGPLDAPSPTTATVVLENYAGDYDPLNTASPYFGQLDIGQQVRITAVDDPTATVTAVWFGYIDDISPDYGFQPAVTFACSDGLAALGRAQITEAAPAFAGDTTGTRLGRILDSALWPTSLRSLDAGLVTVQDETFGDSALGLAARIVGTELGALFVDPNNIMTFYDRLQVYTSSRSTTVQATFSDTGTDIDMPELTGAVARSETFNQVRVTRNGGTEQIATDTASQALRGILTFSGSVGTMAETDVDAASTASFVLARYVNPAVRFPQLVIDATTQGMWTELLALQRFDRVEIQRTYGTAAVSFTRQALISGIGHQITADQWQMSFALRDAESFSPFILGTSSLGGPNLLV